MKILLVNQCFYPDVVSTAQHLTDLALELQARGHEVTVVASSRGYDEPQKRFARRERWQGITILRIPCTGFGKGAKWRRAVDFASYIIACAWRMLFLPKHDLTIGMTSPPLVSFLSALFARLKGGRFVFWVMDLNPDEAIAAGWLRPDSLAAKFFAAILRYSLRVADRIVVLDRFMKRRIADKGIAEDKIAVIPPWSHDEAVYYNYEGQMAFRTSQGLAGKYVVMYSGNHSPCHPLDTLLSAARQLSARHDIAFCFIGGGSEFAKVKAFAREHQLDNITCLPYQPMAMLSASLSAADLHVVVMGDPFVGMIHPCKIYNILSVGARFLYIGPEESHVVDILSHDEVASQAVLARHGEVETVVGYIVKGANERRQTKTRQTSPVAQRFAKELLSSQLIAVLEGERVAPLAADVAAANS